MDEVRLAEGVLEEAGMDVSRVEAGKGRQRQRLRKHCNALRCAALHDGDYRRTQCSREMQCCMSKQEQAAVREEQWGSWSKKESRAQCAASAEAG